MAKTTITTTIELTPEQLTTLIKNYFKDKKGIDVTNVNYRVSDTSDDRFGGSPSYNLSRIEVINETNQETIL